MVNDQQSRWNRHYILALISQAIWTVFLAKCTVLSVHKQPAKFRRSFSMKIRTNFSIFRKMVRYKVVDDSFTFWYIIVKLSEQSSNSARWSLVVIVKLRSEVHIWVWEYGWFGQCNDTIFFFECLIFYFWPEIIVSITNG